MIKAEAPTVLAAVSRAAKTIAATTYMPILGCVRLEAGDGQMRVRATNLEQWIEVTAPASGELDPVCVDAARLQSALRGIGAGEVDLAERVAGLALRGSSTRALLPILPTDEWPTTAEVEGNAVTLRLPAGEMARIASAVIPFAATNEPRKFLCAACLTVTRKGVTLTACDGRRLIRLDVAAEVEGSISSPVIIPLSTLRLVTALAGEVEIFANERKLRASADGMTIVSRLVGGTYPEIDRIIPAPENPIAELNADDLAAAASRIAWADDEKKSWIGLRLRASEPGLMWAPITKTPAETDLECKATADIEIGLLAADIITACAAVKGRQVVLHAAGKYSAVRIVADGDDAPILVIMPGSIPAYQPNKEMIDG